MARADNRWPVSLFDTVVQPGSIVRKADGKPLVYLHSMGGGVPKRRAEPLQPKPGKRERAAEQFIPNFQPHQEKQTCRK